MPVPHTVEKTGEMLLCMYGADHKPHGKELQRVAQRLAGKVKHSDINLADEWQEGWPEETYAEDDEGEPDAEDDDEEWAEEEEVPPELDEAYEMMEEANVGYEEARKIMTSLATARGFYPVVALGPDGSSTPVVATSRAKGNAQPA